MSQSAKAASRLAAVHQHLEMDHYDVAVVGMGALGSAAAYHAGKKGARVIAFEQFELGHVRGASHDTSRIVRTSYEHPEYVALAKSAYEDWAELEAASKQKLLTITGGVVILPKDKGAPAPDRWTNGVPTAGEWTKNLDANKEQYELLNHDEANKRWPAFDLKEEHAVIYSSNTGIVHAYKAITAMQFLARMHGVEVKELTKVERLIPATDGSRTVIKTSKGTFSASKVILASDAWTNELLSPFGVHVPVRITQEQVTYFKPSHPEAYQADVGLPVWIWAGPQWSYGFPCYGEPTIKAGFDNAEQYTTPEERTFVPSRDKIDQLAAHLQSFIPDAGRQELRTVTCQYTMTQDRQFVISPLSQNRNIIVTLGAAHGFKFAPAIGRVAAELAIDGVTKEDISKFRIEAVSTSMLPTHADREVGSSGQSEQRI